MSLSLCQEVVSGANAVVVVTVFVAVVIVSVSVSVVAAAVCRPVGNDAPCRSPKWPVPRDLRTPLAPPQAVPVATNSMTTTTTTTKRSMNPSKKKQQCCRQCYCCYYHRRRLRGVLWPRRSGGVRGWPRSRISAPDHCPKPPERESKRTRTRTRGGGRRTKRL